MDAASATSETGVIKGIHSNPVSMTPPRWTDTEAASTGQSERVHLVSLLCGKAGFEGLDQAHVVTGNVATSPSNPYEAWSQMGMANLVDRSTTRVVTTAPAPY